MIVAFTGHRPPKIGGFRPCAWHERIKDWIRSQLVELKPERAISGMALGVDQWAAAICIELAIPFVAAVPFPGFELKWPLAARKRYEVLIDAAERVHVVSEKQPVGYAEAVSMLDDRNMWMVEGLRPKIVGSRAVGIYNSDPPRRSWSPDRCLGRLKWRDGQHSAVRSRSYRRQGNHSTRSDDGEAVDARGLGGYQHAHVVGK